MHKSIQRALPVFIILLLAGTALAAEPTQPPAPAPAPPTDAPAPAAARPSEADVGASLAAIRAADTSRLLSDRVYAAELLVHLDRLAPLMSDDAGAAAVRNLRLLALATLDRRAEGTALIDQVIDARPNEVRHYVAAWVATLNFQDRARAVTLVETASRAVPGVHWADLRSLLDRETVFSLLRDLNNPAGKADRIRLAAALFRIGWPGGSDTESTDAVRSILLEDRLAAGDMAAARSYADGVTTLSETLTLSLGKRYDPILPADADRMAMIRAAVDLLDRRTRDALAATPGDIERVDNRIHFLRRLGREEDALAVARPFLRDVRATAGNGDYGMWVLNEAAFALAALGRRDEALALMERIAALPLADNPGLISLRINHLELLWDAGRHDEVLRRAAALDPGIEHYANDYGQMWIASSRVCALASLGRPAEAAPLLARLVALRDTNAAALSRAYLCLGDDEAAAALLVHRLESDDPDSVVLALQDYTLGTNPAGPQPTRALITRLLALRERPEVRIALDRAGRTLSLPLARSYWGDF
jgi:tetratricopeptide (TPR) repeat protein